MSLDSHGRVPAGRIVLIRHGETEWSRSGRHTGRTDIPLTPDGERRAAALLPALRGFRFALVATSPRTRAISTADLAGLIAAPMGGGWAGHVGGRAGHGQDGVDGVRPPTADVAAREVWPDLAEWDYGDLEGLTTPRIRESQPGWTIWTGRVPGGETAAAIAARADAVLARALPLLRDGDVALVGHGHMSRVLVARWLGMDAARGASFLVEPASLTILGHERETRVLGSLNLHPSAPDAGLDAVQPGTAARAL
ncbi:histidine phosphatase family protein [Pseudofrankia sp. DC12]|uniref:histidine phosphatase family protein n=1 Tax=Pseudofrankia sp. DC12 TaxID=683315 RepID=UPI000697542F|nr:histidine phosphatase family protein [Pseudofrankia sp. DC12]